jgi:hypothetical protein
MCIAWEVPESAALPAKEYLLHRVTDGVDAYFGPGTRHLEKDVKPSTVLQWKVKARNDAGWSPWSPLCQEMCLQDTAVEVAREGSALEHESSIDIRGLPPDPPLVMAQAKLHAIEVHMEPTKDDGFPVVGFELQHFQDRVWTTLTEGESAVYEDKCLKPMQERIYRARCRNTFGWSGWSSVPKASASALGMPPGQPPTLVATPKESAVVLSVLAPTDDASPVDAVELQHLHGASQWTTLMMGDGDVFVHSGLKPMEEQRYRARCRNAAGWSGWSEASAAASGFPPDPPLITTKGKINAVGIRLEPPKDNGCPVTIYELQSREGSEWIPLMKENKLEFDHVGLKPSEQYHAVTKSAGVIGLRH